MHTCQVLDGENVTVRDIFLAAGQHMMGDEHRLNIQAVAEGLPFDICRVVSLCTGPAGEALIQAEHLNAETGIPRADIPFVKEPHVIGKFAMKWPKPIDGSFSVVITATDALRNAIGLPITGEALVGVVPVRPRIMESSEDAKPFKSMSDRDNAKVFVTDIKAWPQMDNRSIVARRTMSPEKCAALLEQSNILVPTKLRLQLSKYAGMEARFTPAWLSVDFYPQLQSSPCIASDVKLERLLSLDFILMDKSYLSVADMLPASVKWNASDRTIFCHGLSYLDKMLVCVFCVLFDNTFRELRQRVEFTDLQYTPMDVLDHLLHTVLSSFGSICNSSPGASEGIKFYGRPVGAAQRILAALIVEHFASANVTKATNEMPTTRERQRVYDASKPVANAGKKKLEEGEGVPVPTKRGKVTSEPENVPRLCTQFALNLFKEKNARPCAYPECKRDHNVSLVSGGKDAALAYIKMRAATPAQEEKLSKIASAFTGY